MGGPGAPRPSPGRVSVSKAASDRIPEALAAVLKQHFRRREEGGTEPREEAELSGARSWKWGEGQGGASRPETLAGCRGRRPETAWLERTKASGQAYAEEIQVLFLVLLILFLLLGGTLTLYPYLSLLPQPG